jgi:hypothetical protein
MPTPTYTPLATITLGSSASSVTFGSIPATYRDLVLVSQAALTTGTSAVLFRFNGDSGSNYPSVYQESSEVGLAGGNINTIAIRPSGNINEASTDFAIYTLNIMEYSITSKPKSFLLRSNRGSYATVATAGRWTNTSAVNSVSILPNSGSWATGSTFNLYGIAA